MAVSVARKPVLWLALVGCCCLAGAGSGLVGAQSNDAAGVLGGLPGGATAGGIMAASADGLSTYLAPDGPIQPALTAIGGLPMRATEMTNRGISRISTDLSSSATGLSRSAGQGGQIRMPGMSALGSAMPSTMVNIGEHLQGAIRSKNNFIRGQAERGVEAGERLRSMMQGMQVRSSKGMSDAGHMVGQMQDSMAKGASQLHGQLQQSLEGHMNRMASLQGMGGNIINHAQELGQILQRGLMGTVEQLSRTGQEIRQHTQQGHEQNMGAVSGMMGSMSGSMQNMGSNMQKNLHGMFEQATNAAQQVHEHLHTAAQGPLQKIQSMVPMKSQSGGGSGRY